MAFRSGFGNSGRAAAAGAATVAVAVAGFLGWQVLRDDQAPVPPQAPATAQAPQVPAIPQAPQITVADPAPEALAAIEPAVEPAATGSEAQPEVETPAPIAPRFDVVRVDAAGGAVIAGRAEPRAEVQLLLNNTQIQVTRADAQGNFVALLSMPPSDQPRMLSLTMVMADGSEVQSDETVIVAPTLRPATVVASAEPAAEAPLPGRATGEAVALLQTPAVAGAETGTETVTGVPTATPRAAAIPAPEAVPVPVPTETVALAEPTVTGTDTVAATVPAPVAENGAVAPVQTVVAETPATTTETPVTDGPAAPLEIASAEVPVVAPAPAVPSATTPVEPVEAATPTPPATVASETPVAGTPVVEVAVAETPVAETPAAETPVAVASSAPQQTPATIETAAPLPAQPVATPAPAAPQAPAIFVADASGVRTLQPAGAAPQVQENVVLDVISYDTQGEVVLAGRGRAEAGVQVYLDNQPVRLAAIGPGGDWRAELPEVDPGTYTLRVDQVDAQGQVSSRVETPFLREELAVLSNLPQSDGINVVTVQPGFTLWGIARDRWGEGTLYVQVYEANRDQIRDPDLIYPGQIFTIPELSE